MPVVVYIFVEIFFSKPITKINMRLELIFCYSPQAKKKHKMYLGI